jgi:hypothetical protein
MIIQKEPTILQIIGRFIRYIFRFNKYIDDKRDLLRETDFSKFYPM